jgi:hypothetical protein
MREQDLPSPGPGNSGHHLRRLAVKMISQLEISAVGYPSGKHPDASQLRAFFSACADSLIPLDETPLSENS